MNTKPEQFNEKIAEWLDIPYSLCGVVTCPNFYHSQDTHGPIIEKLRKEYGIITIAYTYLDDASDSGNECCELIKANRVVLGYGQAPIMLAAFCLAVEKIIDEEE